MVLATLVQDDAPLGAAVTLHGLQHQAELNGQLGLVCDGPRDDLKLPVVLHGSGRRVRVPVRCLFFTDKLEDFAPLFQLSPVAFAATVSAQRGSFEAQHATSA